MLGRSAGACFLVAAACFAALAHLFAAESITPVIVPLPGPGQTVAAAFDSNIGGNFRLVATVVLPPGDIHESLDDAPPLPSDLSLDFDRAALHQDVASLQRGARYFLGRVDDWLAPEPIALGRGNHTVRITNNGQQPFGEAGALPSLVREQNPAGSFFPDLWPGTNCRLARDVWWVGFIADCLLPARMKWNSSR